MNAKPTVALGRCRTYDAPAVRSALETLLAPLDGMGAFVKPGQSVLIKPNLLTDRAPAQAVTTHPEVVRAVIRLARACGGIVSVADSPGGPSRLAAVWEKTGMAALCAEEDVPLISLEKAGSVAVERDGCRFSVAKPVLDADVLISVPKVKTHVLTTLTAAVKNLYGCVPGYQKAQLHKLHPTPADYGRLMAAIYRSVKTALHVADGVIGMEGEGPSGGAPVELGFLAASADGVALDLVLCRLLGIRPAAVPYLRELSAGQPALTAPDGVATVGAPPSELAARGFRLPNTTPSRLIPRPLVRLLAPFLWIRPAISDLCVRCGRCVQACPAHALAFPEGRGRVILTPEQCIGCCCCHEICPAKSIRMRQSPLLNLVRCGKML